VTGRAGGAARLSRRREPRTWNGVEEGAACSSGRGRRRANRAAPLSRPPASRASRARPVAVVHRLALYDDAEAIVNIISQTDIVR
jgi:hypothetical protein